MSVILIATGAMAAGGTRSAADSDRASRDAAVRGLWATLDAKWNEREARPFSEVFTDDASLEFVGRGPALEGRESILRHFAEQFPRTPPDLRHRTSVLHVRPVESATCAIDGKVEILRVSADAAGNPSLVRTFSVFAVMRETAQGWRVQMLRAYQLPDPA
jgi:uncharacterized protein (TIGR02246 family)